MHALFSPSAAHRWMACPGSLALSQGIADKGSAHAAEGTAAHELAARCLSGGLDALGFKGQTIEADGRAFTVDDEMAGHVQVYLDNVREYAARGHLMVEQRVEFSRWIGQADQFGTSDAIVVCDGGQELQVHDLKYGRGVKVDAEHNAQLMLYALGALDLVEPLGWDAPARVRLVIHQPRLQHLSEWDCSVAELLDFANCAKYAAQQAQACLERGVDEARDLHPGEKQCRWCPAAATCSALARHVEQTVGADFEAIADPDVQAALNLPEDLRDDALALAMGAVGMVEDWCKAVRAETERRLLAGVPVAGWKLVEGRRGARRWSDPAEAEAALKTMRLRVNQMYDLELISPTTAEKLAKVGDIGPKQWPKLQALIGSAEGKPSVAPESDKRPALVITATADEFEVVSSQLSPQPAEAADIV